MLCPPLKFLFAALFSLLTFKPLKTFHVLCANVVVKLVVLSTMYLIPVAWR